MILSLAILLLAGQVESDCVRVPRAGGCVRANGRSGAGLAFFEAFPASGAGTSGVCSTTAPTGAKGETLTFTRGSSATCTKTATGGLVTSGIADGALVELSSNQPRVEYDAQGYLGLLVEESRQNVMVRFIDYANAAWADVGTPTLTGSQNSPWSGTYATSAVQFDDNDGVAFEGRSQAVTVSAGAAYTMHCYVKAGTATDARITLDGTAATITGLSASTWSIIEVTDASSSGVSISAQAMVGDAVGDTGTVIFGGCQVEAGTYRTSIIPTVAAAVTRSAENADFPLALSPASGVSVAATLNVVSTSAMLAGSGLWLPSPSGGSLGAAFTSPYVWHYAGSTGGNLSIDATGSASAGAATAVSGATSGRYYSTFSAAWTVCRDASCAASGALSWSGPTWTRLKLNATPGVTPSAHLWSRICVDPDPSRCR